MSSSHDFESFFFAFPALCSEFSRDLTDMHFSLRYDPIFTTYDLRRGIRATQTLASSRVKEKDDILRRRRVLRTVDKQLSKGNHKAALSLVKQLRGKPGGLIGFGAAKQVSKRISSLEELNLTEMETSSLQALLDSILASIKRGIQRGLVLQLSSSQLENSVNGESYNSPFETHLMCAQHEAGHFLVGYLLGDIPIKYTLAVMEAVKQKRLIGGSVTFPVSDFQREVDKLNQSGNSLREGKITHRAIKPKVSSTGLSKFLCVTVGGLVAEHLVFGRSMGLLGDVVRLDSVLKSLRFTEEEAYSLTRWAALNTVLMLRHHGEARSSLAEAMAQGRSVGFCIDTIENNLSNKEI